VPMLNELSDFVKVLEENDEIRHVANAKLEMEIGLISELMYRGPLYFFGLPMGFASDIQVVQDCPTTSRVPPEKRSKGVLTGSRVIINACRPYGWRERFPKIIRSNNKLRDDAVRKVEKHTSIAILLRT
jgi:hypothetical protein